MHLKTLYSYQQHSIHSFLTMDDWRYSKHQSYYIHDFASVLIVLRLNEFQVDNGSLKLGQRQNRCYIVVFWLDANHLRVDWNYAYSYPIECISVSWDILIECGTIEKYSIHFCSVSDIHSILKDNWFMEIQANRKYPFHRDDITRTQLFNGWLNNDAKLNSYFWYIDLYYYN